MSKPMAAVPLRSKAAGARYLRFLIALGALLLVSALIAGFVVWPRSPANLVRSGVLTGELYSRWKAGELVVLVRHGERCDRSGNACLGPADGITVVGQKASLDVGSAFRSMGMEHTLVLTSPLSRTVQTAASMFGQVAGRQDWLATCNGDISKEIKSQKQPGQNLILVTHSNCIGTLEMQMGFPYAEDADYASSLFASIGRNGKLKVLGKVNAQDWPALMARIPTL